MCHIRSTAGLSLSESPSLPEAARAGAAKQPGDSTNTRHGVVLKSARHGAASCSPNVHMSGTFLTNYHERLVPFSKIPKPARTTTCQFFFAPDFFCTSTLIPDAGSCSRGATCSTSSTSTAAAPKPTSRASPIPKWSAKTPNLNP